MTVFGNVTLAVTDIAVVLQFLSRNRVHPMEIRIERKLKFHEIITTILMLHEAFDVVDVVVETVP